MEPSIIPPTGFVRLPKILEVIPYGKTTWWNGVREGRFPKPIKLGPNTTAWRCEDIHQLIADLGNQPDAEA